MTHPTADTVVIHIMGKEYVIACPPEEENKLVQAAQHLDNQMRQIRESGKVIGVERIAVMAALNLSHELLEHQEETSGAVIVNDEGISRLNHKLEAALHRLKQLEI